MRRRGLSPEDIGTWTGILDRALRSSMDAFDLSGELRRQFEEEHWRAFVIEGLARLETLRGRCERCGSRPAHGVGCEWATEGEAGARPRPTLVFLCRPCRESWGE